MKSHTNKLTYTLTVTYILYKILTLILHHVIHFTACIISFVLLKWDKFIYHHNLPFYSMYIGLFLTLCYVNAPLENVLTIYNNRVRVKLEISNYIYIYILRWYIIFEQFHWDNPSIKLTNNDLVIKTKRDKGQYNTCSNLFAKGIIILPWHAQHRMPISKWYYLTVKRQQLK